MYNKLNDFSLLKRCILQELWSKNKIVMTNLTISYLLQSITGIVCIYALEVFLKSLEDSNFTKTAWMFLGLAFVEIVHHVVDGYNVWQINVFTKKVDSIFIKNIIERVDKEPAESFYKVNFLNNMESIKKGTKEIHNILVLLISVLCYYVPYMLGLYFYLGCIELSLVSYAILLCIPTVVSQILITRQSKEFEKKARVLRRKQETYKKYLIDEKYNREIRLQTSVSYFLKIFRDSRNEYTIELGKLQKKYICMEIGLKIFSGIGFGCSVFKLVVMCWNGEIAIAVFVTALKIINDLINTLVDLVVYDSQLIVMNYASIINYCKYMMEKEKVSLIKKEKDAAEKIISLENVCYKFPESKEKILNNIAMSVRKGEKIAVVGENGAGKSTLGKIILGILKPTTGNIILGHDSLDRNLLSMIGQTPVKYMGTLLDNIVISDVCKIYTEKDIEDDIRTFGIEIEKLPYGLDTVLASNFGGIDLSGGQWNRIAILRAIFRDSDVLVLDEPTAALDAFEENKMFELILSKANDRAVIFITHRLGATKNVDRIIVMKNGEIKESGNYEELMKKEGMFYQMYLKQANIYS